jgi:nitroreductase
MNSTIEVLRGRTSLRRYKDQPISKEHVDLIIGCIR